MAELIDYGFGISAIDAGYMRPKLAAIHLIVEGDRAAIVDTGSRDSVPAILAALAAKNIAPDRVEWIMLTHIHLDHAGGAGALMRELPRARLSVHPRGVRHMINPAQLFASVSRVYGAQKTHALYGDVVPIDAQRIVPTPQGAHVELAGRRFDFYETPGHAAHHVAIHDVQSGRVFAGDSYGLSYRELDVDDQQFVFPTTSPVQFDPQAYHRSIDLIAGLASDAVYVTHFSQVRAPQQKAAALHRLVDAHAALALALRDAGATRAQRLHEGVRQLLLDEARRFGSALSEEALLDVYGMDVELNAQGLGVWLDMRVAR
jgi:hydroxyacylglutathione hydrolase